MQSESPFYNPQSTEDEDREDYAAWLDTLGVEDELAMAASEREIVN